MTKPHAPRAAALDIDADLFLPTAAQIGSETEEVRRLVMEAEQRLTQFETVKATMVRLIEPVGHTLKALETAEADRLTLKGSLAETRETLAEAQQRLSAHEKQAHTFEIESERATSLLSDAHRGMSALEASRRALAAELAQRNSELTGVQRQLIQRNAEIEAAGAERSVKAELLGQTQRRQLTLEAELQAARQTLALTSQDQDRERDELIRLRAETARLSEQASTHEEVWSVAQPQLAQLEKALAEAEAERDQLRRSSETAAQRHHNETGALETRLEALTARQTLSDSMLDDMRVEAAMHAERLQVAERCATEIRLARDLLQSRLDHVEAALAQRDARIAALEQAAIETRRRNDTLEGVLAIRGDADARAREQLSTQAERIATLEARIEDQASANGVRVSELQDLLRRERLERAMIEGALEAGRSDMTRLLRELSTADSVADTASARQTLAESLERTRSAA